jgi:hypothetical protein
MLLLWRQAVARAVGPSLGRRRGASSVAAPTFDKYRVVQRLEEHGLTRKQADAVVGVLHEVVRER